MPDPLFTVFTATYNRATTLPRVRDSLARQTFRDFEWLIVDDGSTDGTPELVEGWIADGDLDIRYLRKPNGGKHTAWNVGITEARGSLFVSFDSDDACIPEALEVFHDEWTRIEPERRAGLVGVCCLVMDPDGNVVGDRFPEDVMDTTSDALRFVHHVTGDKWSFMRIEVARAFPFPEHEGMRYVPESIVWGRIASHYHERYVNKVLQVRHPDGSARLTNASWEDARANALGSQVALEEKAARWLRHDPAYFLRMAARYSRNSWLCSVGTRQQLRDLHGGVARALWLLMLPVGRLLYLRDARRRRAATGS